MHEDIFEYGIIVGRFQHIHSGHEKLINIGIKLCKKVVIFIGSVDSQITKRNPYSYEYRKMLIEEIYKAEIEKGKIIIASLKDLEDKTLLSPVWGKYVLDSAKDIIGKYPNCIIYGKDKDIFKCFSKEVVKNLTEVYVDRTSLGICATQMREYLLKDDKEEWSKYANPKIQHRYEDLREKLLEACCKND